MPGPRVTTTEIVDVEAAFGNGIGADTVRHHSSAIGRFWNSIKAQTSLLTGKIWHCVTTQPVVIALGTWYCITTQLSRVLAAVIACIHPVVRGLTVLSWISSLASALLLISVPGLSPMPEKNSQEQPSSLLSVELILYVPFPVWVGSVIVHELLLWAVLEQCSRQALRLLRKCVYL